MSVWLPVAGYLLGSIPFAFVAVRRVAGLDVRAIGSGNVGASNVIRTTTVPLGVAVGLLEMGKGAAAVWLASALEPGAGIPAATAFAAVVGHAYPIWLGFRGGKGVAVAAGAFAMLAPVPTLAAAGIFAFAVWLTRYISLGSLLAALALPGLVLTTIGRGPVLWSSLAAAALIVLRHTGNVRRLLDRTERRLGEAA